MSSSELRPIVRPRLKPLWDAWCVNLDLGLSHQKQIQRRSLKQRLGLFALQKKKERKLIVYRRVFLSCSVSGGYRWNSLNSATLSPIRAKVRNHRAEWLTAWCTFNDHYVSCLLTGCLHGLSVRSAWVSRLNKSNQYTQILHKNKNNAGPFETRLTHLHMLWTTKML